jgi:hypothetical protein
VSQSSGYTGLISRHTKFVKDHSYAELMMVGYRKSPGTRTQRTSTELLHTPCSVSPDCSAPTLVIKVPSLHLHTLLFLALILRTEPQDYVSAFRFGDLFTSSPIFDRHYHGHGMVCYFLDGR